MFKTGDKVVCVDASGPNNLVEGDIYTIKFAGFLKVNIENPFYDILKDEEHYTIHIYEVQHKKEFMGWKPKRFNKINPLKKIKEAIIKDKSGLEQIKKEIEKEIEKDKKKD